VTAPADSTALSPLLVERQGDLAWLCLNRPQRRNALDHALVAALERAVHDAIADPEIRVIVITGTGDSFCAGADLSYLGGVAARGGDPLELLTRISECLALIEQCPKPVIAAVHGHVVAGGLELALVCDAVIAHTGTLIGDGHARNNLLPGGGASVRLARAVGLPLARWLLLSGELLPAEAFLPSGFVLTVAAEESFHPSILDAARRLRHAAPGAQADIKALLANLADLSTAAGLAAEHSAFQAHWRANDMTSALARFGRSPEPRQDGSSADAGATPTHSSA
jgi:enoyl-CoA hydratase/carnithine racemase